MAKAAAKGTLLQLDTGSTAVVWTTVAFVRNMGLSGSERERIDVTSHESTGGYREKVAGFIEPGSVEFDGVYDPSNATHSSTGNGLAAKFTAGTTEDWRIIPAGSTADLVTFSGFMNRFDLQFDIEGFQAFTAGIEISGAVTYP